MCPTTRRRTKNKDEGTKIFLNLGQRFFRGNTREQTPGERKERKGEREGGVYLLEGGGVDFLQDYFDSLPPRHRQEKIYRRETGAKCLPMLRRRERDWFSIEWQATWHDFVE